MPFLAKGMKAILVQHFGDWRFEQLEEEQRKKKGK
jgi:hypothetical protein